jgi:heme exporter protein A
LQEVAAKGRTVVMTSHDIARAANLASRVDILSKGVIAASVAGSQLDPAKLPALYRSVTYA